MKLIRKLRTELIAGVLALCIATFFGFHVLHFSHRNAAERTVWKGLPFWQTLEAFEYRLYDSRFAFRGEQKPKSLDKIAIIAIDEDALQLANWPFPRSMHARLVRKLKAAGAKVVVLDFDFSQSTPDDKVLSHAMRDAGNVVLPSYLTPENRKVDSGKARSVLFRTTTPLEYFDEYTPDLALGYVPLDSDGRVRRYPFYGVLFGSNIGSIAALTNASYQGLLGGADNSQYEKALQNRLWPTLNGTVSSVPVTTSRSVKTKQNQDMPVVFSTPLYFYGPKGTVKTYSYADVFEGDDREYSDAGLKQKFGGKIVMVGATTHILKDVFSVPTFNTEADDDSSIMPGVELHATAAAMLLDGNFIHTQSTRQTLWLLFGLTLGASLWTAALRTPVSRAARGAQVLWARRHLPGQVHTPMWIALYVLVGTLPVLLFWWLAKRLFVEQSLWVIVVYPAISAALATGLVLLLLFAGENAERHKAQTIFERAASPELLAKMLASGQDYLKPENVCVTVLFSDLEGFTTYSETHSPQEVIEVTNDFLSSVVPIIHKYDGWVDKYIGDAIMAVFGALVPREDHAAVALRCAVEMQDAAAQWRQKTGIAFYMRVGIHSGEVIAGYMGSRESAGSRERMDFTVIGDTVNLASRLEGKNKEFDSWIMCSAETFRAAPEVVAATNASAPIKGKSQAVDVFIITGLQNDSDRVKYWSKPAL